jgi:hypothetical protein
MLITPYNIYASVVAQAASKSSVTAEQLCLKYLYWG